ncbi:MAG: DinB family protein [Anaerolineales bacterium]|nr:DinB family protein [Anaerolineales bacterium]
MTLKEELVREMENTRRDFHHLLDSVPEDFYHLPSDNPAWTVGEVLFHMSLAPRFLTADLRLLLGQAWIARIIGALLPKSLFDRLNEYFTKRWASRVMTREKLRRAYDVAHDNARRSLDKLEEDDFGKSLEYPNYDELLSGVVSVEKLYRYITIHFNAHAEQIRRIIEPGTDRPNSAK